MVGGENETRYPGSAGGGTRQSPGDRPAGARGWPGAAAGHRTAAECLTTFLQPGKEQRSQFRYGFHRTWASHSCTIGKSESPSQAQTDWSKPGHADSRSARRIPRPTPGSRPFPDHKLGGPLL